MDFVNDDETIVKCGLDASSDNSPPLLFGIIYGPLDFHNGRNVICECGISHEYIIGANERFDLGDNAVSVI